MMHCHTESSHIKTFCSEKCRRRYLSYFKWLVFKLFVKRLVGTIITVAVGLLPATLLYILMRPELAVATAATWREALLWAVALTGVCVSMAVKESVDERAARR